MMTLNLNDIKLNECEAPACFLDYKKFKKCVELANKGNSDGTPNSLTIRGFRDRVKVCASRQNVSYEFEIHGGANADFSVSLNIMKTLQALRAQPKTTNIVWLKKVGDEVIMEIGVNEYKSLQLHECNDLQGIDQDNFRTVACISDVKEFSSKLEKCMRMRLQRKKSDSSYRENISGVNFVTENGMLLMMATDTHRLVVDRVGIDNPCDNGVSVNFNGDVIENMSWIIRDYRPDNIVIKRNDTDGIMMMGNVLIHQKNLFDYPNYKNVTDHYDDNAWHLGINRNELLSAISQFVIPKNSLQSSDPRMFFEYEENILNVYVSSGWWTKDMRSKSKVLSVPCSLIGPDVPVMSFNQKYLIEALESFKSEEVHISGSGQLKPITITIERDFGSQRPPYPFVMVMPMQTQAYQYSE